MDQKVIIVLGMHRSGTSMLTGCLEEAGLYLGDVYNKYNPHNAKGQKEQIFLMELHEEVLKSNGGTWDLPPYKNMWKYFHNKARQHYILSMKEHKTWGFKDPRVLFLLDKWLEDIPNALLVGIFRHPLEVADSLYRRNKMSFNQGLDLWYRYNLKLLNIYKDSKFPIIEFDNDINQLQESVAMICQKLGLENIAMFNFPDQKLRTRTAVDIALPNRAMSLYQKLQSIKLKS